jgi:hypothetical protein
MQFVHYSDGTSTAQFTHQRAKVFIATVFGSNKLHQQLRKDMLYRRE